MRYVKDFILPTPRARVAYTATLSSEVRTNARVSEVTAEGVRFASGDVINSELVVWAAGVKAPNSSLAAAGQQVPTPTGTIEFISVLIDVQGEADLTKVMVNGKLQKLAPGRADVARACKKGGWKTMENPKFKNQGQCVRAMAHARNAARKSGG